MKKQVDASSYTTSRGTTLGRPEEPIDAIPDPRHPRINHHGDLIARQATGLVLGKERGFLGAHGLPAKFVCALIVLAETKRRARTGRPRAIHIYEQKGETRVGAETTQTPLASFMSRDPCPDRSRPQSTLRGLGRFWLAGAVLLTPARRPARRLDATRRSIIAMTPDQPNGDATSILLGS